MTMTPQLSWDLHVHPGPTTASRWGDGQRIWQAARNASVSGFVWKSHDEHTARRCRDLPAGPPYAFGSASLNGWARLEDVLQAIEDGAVWIWGATRLAGGRFGWDLELPAWWDELAAHLHGIRTPLVLATGHLGQAGRRSFAEAAAANANVRCSVTHSLYLSAAERDDLRRLGCAFEVDLYTLTHPLPRGAYGDLLSKVERLQGADALVYLTSDAGQAEVGDPYVFSAKTLVALERRVGTDLINALAISGPDTMAAHVRIVGAPS